MTVYTITSLAADFVSGLDNTVDPTASTNLSLVQVASVLLGVVLPILVGLVTKHSTSDRVQSLLLAGLAALSGFLTEFINSDNFVWQQAVLTTVVTFVIAVAAHYGLWKPTGVADAALNVGPGRNHNVEGGAVDTRTLAIVAVVLVVIVILFLVL
jgi:hypothetical protein